MTDTTGSIGNFIVGQSLIGGGTADTPTPDPPSSTTTPPYTPPIPGTVALIGLQNMNLAQLQAAVIVETNRPDLVAETLQAVLEATMTVHMTDYWYKDLSENLVVFDTLTDFIQTLNVGALPFCRDIAYIRKADVGVTNTGGATTLGNRFNFVKRVDIGDILDGYGYEKNDIWYQAGKQINIKSSTPLGYARIGWYQYPNLDPTGVAFSSWIATELPAVIIYRAAGNIFAKIGEDKSYAMYLRQPTPGQGYETGGMYYQQLAILRNSNIRAGD